MCAAARWVRGLVLVLPSFICGFYVGYLNASSFCNPIDDASINHALHIATTHTDVQAVEKDAFTDIAHREQPVRRDVRMAIFQEPQHRDLAVRAARAKAHILRDPKERHQHVEDGAAAHPRKGVVAHLAAGHPRAGQWAGGAPALGQGISDLICLSSSQPERVGTRTSAKSRRG